MRAKLRQILSGRNHDPHPTLRPATEASAHDLASAPRAGDEAEIVVGTDRAPLDVAAMDASSSVFSGFLRHFPGAQWAKTPEVLQRQALADPME